MLPYVRPKDGRRVAHYASNCKITECLMFKNGMRPVHPGEILLEDYIKPMGVSL